MSASQAADLQTAVASMYCGARCCAEFQIGHNCESVYTGVVKKRVVIKSVVKSMLIKSVVKKSLVKKRAHQCLEQPGAVHVQLAPALVLPQGWGGVKGLAGGVGGEELRQA